jgi:hypothetical protein
VIFERLRRRLEWDGTRGLPRSSNQASSLHLGWVVPPGEWIEVEAVLEVLAAPRVAALSFWALQVGFVDRGRDAGAAHLGLQWHPGHPGSTAVNWGGYQAGGGELSGSPSPLPSATGNINTRDFEWQPWRPYRLRVSRGQEPAPPGRYAWAGEITDLTTGIVTVVRDLLAAGTHLVGPVVWSEVFARCDDPGASVRWSGLRLLDEGNVSHTVDTVAVNYQVVPDGGCVTTDSSADGLGIVQATGTARTTAQGARLTLPSRLPGVRP